MNESGEVVSSLERAERLAVFAFHQNFRRQRSGNYGHRCQARELGKDDSHDIPSHVRTCKLAVSCPVLVAFELSYLGLVMRKYVVQSVVRRICTLSDLMLS